MRFRQKIMGLTPRDPVKEFTQDSCYMSMLAQCPIHVTVNIWQSLFDSKDKWGSAERK